MRLHGLCTIRSRMTYSPSANGKPSHFGCENLGSTPRGESRHQRVVRMLQDGLPYRAIEKIEGITAPSISYHARKAGIPRQVQKRVDWGSIQQAVDGGRSVRDCSREFGFSKAAGSAAVARGVLVLPAQKKDLPLTSLLSLVSARRTNSYERRLIRRKMVAEGVVDYQCAECGGSTWRGATLVLEVDHIDGNPRNNLLENLRLLCPNCHSITATWRGRNRDCNR